MKHRNWKEEEQKLLETPGMYGIYQINNESDGADYQFMRFEYLKKKNITPIREHYNLVYTGTLKKSTTLEDLYVLFNQVMPRTKKFTGHSMSVSDVIVLNRKGYLQPYYVNSVGFQPLPDFMEEEVFDEIALRIVVDGKEKDRYLSIYESEEGYEYTIFDMQYNDLDGGLYEDPKISMKQAIEEVLADAELQDYVRVPVDFDDLQEKEYERWEEKREETLLALKQKD